MKNKNDITDSIFDAIGALDDSIIKEAYLCDSKEKLEALSGKRRRARMTAPLRRVAVACLCVILSISLVLALPALFKGGVDEQPYPDSETGDGLLYGDVIPGGKVLFDSIDVLNYYSAMRLIRESGNRYMPQGYPVMGRLTKVTSALDTDLSSEETALPPTSPFGTDYPSETMVETPVTKPAIPEDMIAYKFGANEVFTVTKVIYFNVNIKNENGFLASVIGTGKTEVVITENSLENMITFRNVVSGKYYSCLANGGGPTRMDFSTHKYIEGFCIVKNVSQENYSFDITLDKGLVNGISCRRNIGESGEGEPKYIPDELEWIEGSSRTSSVRGSFTVSELEAYYSSIWNGGFDTLPAGSEETDSVTDKPSQPEPIAYYQSETHVFLFYSNGLFDFVPLPNAGEDDRLIYGRGAYDFAKSYVTLAFDMEDGTTHTYTVDVAPEGYFIFMEEKYFNCTVRIN